MPAFYYCSNIVGLSKGKYVIADTLSAESFSIISFYSEVRQPKRRAFSNDLVTTRLTSGKGDTLCILSNLASANFQRPWIEKPWIIPGLFDPPALAGLFVG